MADAEYLAAANPVTVLALLDEIDSYRAELVRAGQIAGGAYTAKVRLNRARRRQDWAGVDAAISALEAQS